MTFLPTQPYKGTRDFFPSDMVFRRWMFGTLRSVVEKYGYLEYDGPMLEAFELYAAKTGEEIVNQQLYWMMDRGERKIAVRPEMTPTLARMVASQVNEIPKPIRWFSTPNLWRYERPQRGRLREHWQLNVDVLGGDRLFADAEILNLSLDLMRAFKGETKVQIKVNNRKLVDSFFQDVLKLDGKTALGAIKAVDARAKVGEEAYKKWLTDLGFNSNQMNQMEKFFQATLGEIEKLCPCEGQKEIESLFSLLNKSGASSFIEFDPKIMRGMDYYTGTVFEMYDQSPENPRAIFGGGRYDNLIGLFGKTQLSGVGFGMGDVTLQNFLETHALVPKLDTGVDVFISWPKLEHQEVAEQIARDLRLKGFRVMTPLEVSNFSHQLKMASKHQAKFAVLFGDQEFSQGLVVIKNLVKGTQSAVKFKDVSGELA